MPPTHGKPSTYTSGCRCDDCKAGHAAWYKKRYEAKREHILATNRASYARHAEKRREAKFVANYGLTYAERDALVEVQGGRCAICGEEAPLELDHCHDTGVVRGMLCGHCNRGIGCLRHDVKVMRKVIAYLEAPSLMAATHTASPTRTQMGKAVRDSTA